MMRLNIWTSNKKYVEMHNANADAYGFTTTMNEYADLVSGGVALSGSVLTSDLLIYRIQPSFPGCSTGILWSLRRRQGKCLFPMSP